MNDLISRQAAIDAMNELPYGYRGIVWDILNGLPSAEPQLNLDEWCTDCKEYDHEKHCCPRFNRVIRKTLEEVKENAESQGWIPVTERLPEESGDYFVTYSKKFAEEYDFSLLVGIAPYDADCEGFGYWRKQFDAHSLGSLGIEFVDIPVTAWMPLPEPWEGEDDG